MSKNSAPTDMVIARGFHDFLRSAAMVVEVIGSNLWIKSLKPVAGIGLLAVVLLFCRHTGMAQFDVNEWRASGQSNG
jgi:hypothetical protein